MNYRNIPPDPINYEQREIVVAGESRITQEASHAMRTDFAIRVMMERAVKYDEETVILITKEVSLEAAQGSLILLHSIVLDWPFVLPDHTGVGSNNKAMREFAFDSYDYLKEHFGQNGWINWFIAPYFDHATDSRGAFCMGVFVDTEKVHDLVNLAETENGR